MWCRNHCLVINPKKKGNASNHAHARRRRRGKRGKKNVRQELTVLLHDGQELDDDLGGRADQDLALAGLLGVVDGIEAVVENGSLDHFGG